CVSSVTAIIVDTCTSCTDGDINLSVQSVADLLGLTTAGAEIRGVVTNASWTVVDCPTSFTSAASTISTTSTSTFASINNYPASPNIGAIAGGVVGAVVFFLAIAFLVFKKLKNSKLVTAGNEQTPDHTPPPPLFSQYYNKIKPAISTPKAVASLTPRTNQSNSDDASSTHSFSSPPIQLAPKEKDSALFDVLNTQLSQRPEAPAFASKKSKDAIADSSSSVPNSISNFPSKPNPDDWSVDEVAAWVVSNGGSEETTQVIRGLFQVKRIK
ncbi:hypothetical protein HK100_006355, partial [Physocladia obscura]